MDIDIPHSDTYVVYFWGVLELTVTKNSDGSTKIDDINEIAKVPARHPDYIHVDNIATKILDRIDHIAKLDWKDVSKTEFRGMHHRMALQEYVDTNPFSSFQLQNRRYPGQAAHDPSIVHNPNLPYECEPVLFKADGTQAVKSNNGGLTSMFPDSWNKQRILEEVEFALANNIGKPYRNRPYIVGFSKPPNPIEIHFSIGADGKIWSYFPFIKT